MRKWFIIGLGFVFLTLVFSIYVIYDTQRFVDNLPPLSPQVKEVPQTPPSQNEPGLDIPPAEVVEGSPSATTDVLDVSGDFVEDNVSSDAEIPSPGEALAPPEEPPVSTMLEELFLKYHVLNEERWAIIRVLEPMHEEHIAMIDRNHEISHALSSGPDPETQDALNNERAALLVEIQDIQPRIFEVQDAEARVVEKLESLVQTYGFSSWEAFRERHEKDYRAWRDTR